MIQNRLLQEDGNDATHLLGTAEPCLERDLYELYQAHFARAVADPKVSNFRLCVEAHDAFLEVFYEGVRP